MEMIEPLIEKSEKIFEWCFDKEVEEHEEDVDLRDTVGQSATHTDDRHKKKIYQKRQKTLPLSYSIDICNQTNTIG